MTLQRLIKRLEFNEQTRAQVTYSNPAKIRLNNDNQIRPLGITLTNPYTTALDAVATTAPTTLNALTELLGFDEDADTPAGTSIGYRVWVGASQYYWTGSAWAAPTLAAHWNTVQEVNDNLPTLPKTSKTFKFDINLRTTGGRTPFLRSIGILGRFNIEWWDDLIYDSVLRLMQTTLRATTDVEFEVASTTSLINLATEYKLENSGYNFTGVILAYNLTADPQKLNNLASSYTPGAARPDGSFEDGQINLTIPVPTGNVLRVTMEHAPEVAVNTSQDYYEPARLPAIVFERIAAIDILDGSGRSDGITDGDVYRNKAAFTGVVIPNPRQFSIRFDYAVFAQLGMDEARIITAIERWVVNHRSFQTYGLDEQIHMDAERGMERTKPLNTDDVRTATGALILRGVSFYLKDSTDVYLVQNFNVDLVNQPLPIGEP